MQKVITALGSKFTLLWGKWKIHLIVLVVVLIIGLVLGWRLHGVFYDADRVNNLETIVKKQNQRIEASRVKELEYETELAKLRNDNNQLTSELQDEVKKPEYNCKLPVDGVRLYRKALASN